MRIRFVFAGIVTAAAALVAGCFSSSSGGSGPDASFGIDSSLDGFGDDSSTEDATTDVAAEASAHDGGSDAPSPGADSSMAMDSTALADAPVFEGDGGDAGGASIRVANVAAGLSSGIDFCVAAAGTAFAGPYLAQQGVTTGLPYPAMSEYAGLMPASSFSVRIVAAGATDCSTRLVPDVTTGPSTDAAPTTIVLAGASGADGGAALGLQVETDDPAATSPVNDRTRFRVIHEAAGLGPATFQIGASPYIIPVQTAVPYGATFAASTMTTGAVTPDAQGYIEPNMGSEQVELVLGGVETMSFYVAAQQVSGTDSVTAFLIGAQGSSATPLGFLACDELAPATAHLAACTFENGAPVTIPTRVLHAAPDQSAIDACVKVGTLPYTSSLLATAGVSGGLSFLQVSGDLTSIPARTDVSVAFAPAGQDCATSQFCSIGTSIAFQEFLVTLSEQQLLPSPAYTQRVFDSGGAASASSATVMVANLGPNGGPSYDYFDTENGMSEVPLVAGPLSPFTSVAGITLTPDTYTLRVVDDSTMQTVYTSPSKSFAANQTYFLGWFDATTPSPGALIVCPLGTRTATSLTTCTD